MNHKWIALLFAVSLSVSSMAALPEDGNTAFWIKSVGAGNCMTISHNSKGFWADVLQWGCSGDAQSAQAFFLTKQANGYWQLKNANSQMCAQIPYGFRSPGIIMKQAPCVETEANDFTIEVKANNHVIFHPRMNPDYCIGIVGRSKGGLAGIAQLECDGTDTQEYILTLIP